MAESNAPRTVSTARIEGLSDGVFSIASTLLVLEIALEPGDTALKQVLNTWPAYLGYLISFLTIAAAWIGHKAITDRLDRADPVLLRINLLFLLVIAFLPFPTKLIAEGIHHTDEERVFVAFYGLTLLTIRLLGFALDEYARRERLYTTAPAEGDLITERRTLVPVVIAYVASIGIGIAFPTVGVLLYLGVALFLIVPFREIGRLFSH
jgi:uncharacterized membrane protein